MNKEKLKELIESKSFKYNDEYSSDKKDYRKFRMQKTKEKEQTLNSSENNVKENQMSLFNMYKKVIIDGNLQELSSDLLRRYKRSAEDKLKSKKQGRPSAKDIQTKEKRTKGISTATQKISAIDKKEHEAELLNGKEIYHHVSSHIPEIMKSHGYHKQVETPSKDIYVKTHPKHVSLMNHYKDSLYSKYREGAEEYRAQEYRPHILTASTSMSYSSSNDRHYIDHPYKSQRKDLETRKADAIAAVHKHIIQHDQDSKQSAESGRYD